MRSARPAPRRAGRTARSNGPKTAEGKARSAKNALKHGLCAKQCLVLVEEDPAAFLAGQLDLTIGTPGAAVVAPILVVRGSTPGIGVEIPDDQLRALGPNVSFATIEGAGQLPHDEAADRVLAAVESWLDGRAGRAGEQR